MKVSVIVPVYNTSRYLEQCVGSIIAQTYKDLEIILVDDGSTDNSGEICDELAKKDGRIVCFHKKNGGLGSARNYGLERATGEYISFIDSDDLADKDMISVLVSDMERFGADMAGSDYLEFCDSLPPVNEKVRAKCVDTDVEGYFLHKNRLYCVVRYLYRRDVLGGLRFDESIRLGEDQDFIFRYVKGVRKASFSTYNGYFYRQNPLSLSSGKLKENHVSDLNCRLKIYADASKKNKKAAYAHYLKGVLAFWCKGIVYGTDCQTDYVGIYADKLNENKWKILFSRHIGVRYKAVALTLFAGKRLARKIVKKYLGKIWKK